MWSLIFGYVTGGDNSVVARWEKHVGWGEASLYYDDETTSVGRVYLVASWEKHGGWGQANHYYYDENTSVGPVYLVASWEKYVG